MTPGGRKKTVSALVVVGNKKGAVGTYVRGHKLYMYTGISHTYMMKSTYIIRTCVNVCT